MNNHICRICGEQTHADFEIKRAPGKHICAQCLAEIKKTTQQKAENESSLFLDQLFEHAIVQREQESEEDFELKDIPSPKELKSMLDDYVIGQEHAKKVFSVAIYNHYKRLLHNETQEDISIEKSNVLLIGPTGSGKTLLAQSIAQYLDVPIAIADATSLTEAGYVGEDVENILTRLLMNANGNVQEAERGIIFIDEIDKIARLGQNRSITRDVSGEGVQQALLKLIEGSVVNVSQAGGRRIPTQSFTPVDTKNILFICGGAFDGLEEIIKKRLGSQTLGFGDISQTNQKLEPNENALKRVEIEDIIAYGMIPELVGRLHIVASLDAVDKETMIRILKEPKNSIIKQFERLFMLDEIDIVFENDALDAIAELAIERKTGARGLRSIVEGALLELMFDIESIKGFKVIITGDVIRHNSQPLLIKEQKELNAAR